MSQKEQDATLGRLTRERAELQEQVAALEAKLHHAGQNFSRLGSDLQNSPPVINVDHASVEKAVSELWDDISNYEKAAAALESKIAELERF